MKLKIKRIQSKNNRWVTLATIKCDDKLLSSFEASVLNNYIPEGVYIPIAFNKLKEIYEYYNIEELQSVINTNSKNDRYLISYYS